MYMYLILEIMSFVITDTCNPKKNKPDELSNLEMKLQICPPPPPQKKQTPNTRFSHKRSNSLAINANFANIS